MQTDPGPVVALHLTSGTLHLYFLDINGLALHLTGDGDLVSYVIPHFGGVINLFMAVTSLKLSRS